MSKITPKQYAEAFLEAATEAKISGDRAIENLIALIHKNGDWRKRKEILEACADMSRKRGGEQLVTILSARPLEKTQREQIEKTFQKSDFEEQVDPELIAGVKIVIDRERQFDGTLKHKLDTILENV